MPAGDELGEYMNAVVCLRCGEPVLMEHTFGDSVAENLEIVFYSCRRCHLNRELRLTRDGVIHMGYSMPEGDADWYLVPEGVLAVFSGGKYERLSVEEKV